MSGYLTLGAESSAEYEEKRSKFIGYAKPCETAEEALSFLEEIKTRHWDARHNCYAFVVKEGGISRFSDDGEPHGTAGKPILEVINGMGLVNVAVVVTRYFGGVLLGTGGLVRAYTKACKDALSSGKIVEMLPCTSFSLTCEYTDHGKLMRLLEESGAEVADTQFTDKVTVIYRLKDSLVEEFNKKLTESFSGKLCANEIEKITAPFSIDL